MLIPTPSAPMALRAKNALPTRWTNELTSLLLQGVPENRARTEAARMAAIEAWELVNGWRRRERDLGSRATAETLEAALRPLQDIVIQLLRHDCDLRGAEETVQDARRSFESSCARGAGIRTGGDAEATAIVARIFGSLGSLLSARIAQAA